MLVDVMNLQKVSGGRYPLSQIVKGKKVFWFAKPDHGLSAFWTDGNMTIFENAPKTIQKKSVDVAKYPGLPKALAGYLVRAKKEIEPRLISQFEEPQKGITHVITFDVGGKTITIDARRLAMGFSRDDDLDLDLTFRIQNNLDVSPIVMLVNDQPRAVLTQVTIPDDVTFTSDPIHFSDVITEDATEDATEPSWCTPEGAPRPKLKVWRARKTFPRFAQDENGFYTVYPGALNPAMIQAKRKAFELGKGGIVQGIHGLMVVPDDPETAIDWSAWNAIESDPAYSPAPLLGIWEMVERQDGPTDEDWDFADTIANDMDMIGLLLIAQLSDGSIWAYFLPGRCPDVRDVDLAYKAKVKSAPKAKDTPEDTPEDAPKALTSGS